MQEYEILYCGPALPSAANMAIAFPIVSGFELYRQALYACLAVVQCGCFATFISRLSLSTTTFIRVVLHFAVFQVRRCAITLCGGIDVICSQVNELRGGAYACVVLTQEVNTIALESESGEGDPRKRSANQESR
ncbi:hypothetical protein L210DRAFT_2088919 [Boletus edulis BED1]|uniref:Uncharacterized protein n=1 Tax=Boletus edulis BED1 TaxID=1328754 RepID=A0AAD4GFE5_BOLED|nr:hypothetical protein L210DRAFT_2088919 [Boletus edulis BED1]